MSGTIRHRLVNAQNPLKMKLMDNAFPVMPHLSGKLPRTLANLRSTHALLQSLQLLQ